MIRKGARTFGQFILASLFIFSTAGYASQPTLKGYMASKPLQLEIRYCDCAATDVGGPNSGLSPAFMRDSKVIKVGVSAEDKGFVSSDDLSIGYELKRVQNSSKQFQFRYMGVYKEGNGESSGAAELVLMTGQWVTLFGTGQQASNEMKRTSVAVRLVGAKGS
jgi:hypothetical protein